MIKLINLGTSANDGTGDSLREAFEKINYNFQLISKDLKIIVWNSLEDTRQAMEDINSNFETISNGKKEIHRNT